MDIMAEELAMNETCAVVENFAGEMRNVKSSAERVASILANEAVLLHVLMLEAANAYDAADKYADENHEFSPVRVKIAEALAGLQDVESILDDANRSIYDALKRANIALLQARRLNTSITLDAARKEE